MGASMHVVGIKPADKKFNEMKAIYDACTKAGVEIPESVSEFFDHEKPDDAGVIIPLFNEYSLAPKHFDAVTKYHGDSESGFEIDVTLLPSDIKKVRFYTAY